jgi:2'-5' RNA ligase
VILAEHVEPLVSAVRQRFDRSAARGMPAHITLLYPFRHPDRIDLGLLEELQVLFAAQPPFSFRLVGLCGFPGVLYLVPQPFEPFDQLTREVALRFPDTPPYAGLVPDPTPHLTVAQTPPAEALADLAAELLATLGPRLPVACIAARATLAIKRAGRWCVAEHFVLGGSPRPLGA